MFELAALSRLVRRPGFLLALSLKLGITLLLLAHGYPAQADAQVKAILKAADAFRLPMDSARVDTEIRSFKGGALDKTRLYAVYVKPGRRSLVLFRSPAEQGQKMLMLGDDFWLVMPASQRPLRITPMQKLLGEASTGDIASMTWADDYDGEVKGEDTVDGTSALRLEIAGQRSGVSYPRIVLFVARKDHRPLAAELYVASDKLAKRAQFRYGEVGGRRLVTAMVLADHLQKDRVTELHYLARNARTLPDEVFNAAYLVRAEVE